MDVSNVAPFSNVECPSCQKHTRVKREFGPYTLLRRHAIGGMSMVFVGHDNTLDREVALKILSEDYSADEKRISSFEEEARITAAISHPHVVRVFKTGKAFGRFYIAMELVAGGHLEHQIKERGALPETEALQMAIEVAEGLRAAHSAGLIHRDIKPGNILLDSAGSAKIVDFGLALMTKGGVAKPDELWATPFYVPPETIDGLEEDYRADVYAFGATFYHVLAGKPPCTEESMVTTQLREAKKHIVPLSIACPKLCMETSAVIECAMAYDPSARFSSYDELIDSLQTALMVAQTREKNIRKGIPVAAAVPKGITAADRRQMAKKRSTQKAMTSVAVLVVIGAVIWAVTQLMSSKPNPDPNPTVVDTDVDPVSTDSAGVEIGSLYQQARKLLENGDYEAAQQSFGQLRSNSKVQEPTRTWCAFEAMLAAFLNGRTQDAVGEAAAVEAHLNISSTPTQFKNRLGNWLENLQQLPPIPKPIQTDKPDSDLIYLMSSMASGLKNWEQGKMADAIPFFEIVKNANNKDRASLIGPYQNKADSYLADWDLLRANELKDLPTSSEECRAQAEKLNEVIPMLKTRGRAKFQVREWQLLLGKHAKALENPASLGTEGGSEFSTTLANANKLFSACQFLDAVESLKQSKPADDKSQAQRDALLGMAEAAGVFLADLEADLAKTSITLALTSKDGRAFTSIISASDGSITCSNGENEATLPWSQFKVADVIKLYSEVLRKTPASGDKALRHEAAISYQWLSGEKDAAQNAAQILSRTSSAFKTRWEQWMDALQ